MQVAAKELSESLSRLTFSSPVALTYNPLDYAWEAHANYLKIYGSGKKRVLFLGMNPGPFGMMQTGIPFGEIAAVQDWMRISGKIQKPANEHPKRPILGWDCTRSEVSGRRLWGLFAEKFPNPKDFFADHFVANFCPLGFLSPTGSNITPDKISASEMAPVLEICDHHLQTICEILEVESAVGVGLYAEKRLKEVLNEGEISISRILHPSPASPAANKDWAGTAEKQLLDQGIW